MGVYRIGNQRIGVRFNTVTGYTDLNEPITETVTRWVDNACFEIQTPSEQENMTVTTSEIGWAMLPVADSVVPAVDDAGDPAPIPFFISNPGQDDDGKPTISSSARLVHNGLVYVMRGDAVLEEDIRGRQDHVFCLCEREQG
jgi:hypothetical protein